MLNAVSCITRPAAIARPLRSQTRSTAVKLAVRTAGSPGIIDLGWGMPKQANVVVASKEAGYVCRDVIAHMKYAPAHARST